MKQIKWSHQSRSQWTGIWVESYLTPASDYNINQCIKNHCIPDSFYNYLQGTSSMLECLKKSEKNFYSALRNLQMDLTMTEWGKCGWNGTQDNDWDDVLLAILTLLFSQVISWFFTIAKLNRKEESTEFSGFCTRSKCGKRYLSEKTWGKVINV